VIYTHIYIFFNFSDFPIFKIYVAFYLIRGSIVPQIRMQLPHTVGLPVVQTLDIHHIHGISVTLICHAAFSATMKMEAAGSFESS